MKTVKLGIALILCLGLFASLGTALAAAEWGITKLEVGYEDSDGDPVTQAGAHADSYVEVDFNQVDREEVRDVKTYLPAGFYGNPQAIPACGYEELIFLEGYCDPSAQVGIFQVDITGKFVPFPVYTMPNSDSQTAVLATVILGTPVKINISARTDSDFGLIATLSNINEAIVVEHTKLTLWGVPAAPVNDRFRCKGYVESLLTQYGTPCTYSAGIDPKPFLSTPVRCEPARTDLEADTWQHLDLWYQASDETPALTGCDELEFPASLKARPTTNVADSPSGLEADLSIPQNTDDPENLSTAMLKTAEVDLPQGLTVNPSAANGLGACSPAQIGLTTPVGAGNPHFSKEPANCPDDSRIGSVEVETPVFPKPLKGSVYVMSPHDNPFGSLLGIYLAIEGKGLVIKQAGKVITNPKTGQLHATFDQVPQLPFENFHLDFDSGAYGILRTPAACGDYATTSTLTPWSSPETPSVADEDPYAIAKSPSSGSCAAKESARPNSPSFQAGTVSAIAGAYSPFVFKLSRNDGTQQLNGIDAVLPQGLLAKLAGTTYCSDAALAAAAKKDGKAEQVSPSCPGSSRVGSVTVGTGAGPKPFYAPATAYLAGPYKGAPLSLAVVAPAVAGPFDLGTVVVRNALQVDPTTAQVHAVSDPFPTILQGIPLDIRSVDLRLDRPEFTKNPTSCDPFAIAGFASAVSGQQAALNNRFQVGECGRLGFKPALSIKLKGKTKRTGNPALTAVVKYPKGGSYANIKKTTVILPKTEFIDNAHISTPCTRVQFNEAACPRGSILGTARAFSPLLDEPLEGPVYFRSNGGDRELPDLVVDLDGQIHVTLVGFIDSVKVKGAESSRVRTRFVNVPDAPVSKFVLRLYGGKRGLLQNSVNLCKAKVGPASVQMEAQNAKTAFFERPLRTSCRGKKGKKKR
jgi:hypothetical protein